MDGVRRLIGDRGTDFRRYYASFPLCCPARATYITGQYAHNHGVIDNLAKFGGGYPALRNPDAVLPVWLRDSGYDTALVGKWLHDYQSAENPPGWQTFYSLLDGYFTRYYDYVLTDSEGGTTSFGEGDTDYLTDTLTNAYAVPYILSRAANPTPFFLHVSYTAPHWGKGRADSAGRRCATPQPFHFETARPKPAPRYADAFLHKHLPRPPSFNERQMGDKPPAIAARHRIPVRAQRSLAKRYRCELATLLAVDDGVARISHALTATGIDDNTIVIFTSDNGYMHGEHRISGGKVQPYEEAVRVPLLIRGPGFPARERSFLPVADVDLAPTILDIAGIEAPAPPAGRAEDGTSLLRTLGRDGARNRAILLEAKRPAKPASDGRWAVRSWLGVRTRRYSYVEYHAASAASADQGYALPIGAGARVATELYDNKRDPYQLRSKDSSRRYAAPHRVLSRLLDRLRGCEGADCRIDASVPPPR